MESNSCFDNSDLYFLVKGPTNCENHSSLYPLYLVRVPNWKSILDSKKETRNITAFELSHWFILIYKSGTKIECQLVRIWILYYYHKGSMKDKSLLWERCFETHWNSDLDSSVMCLTLFQLTRRIGHIALVGWVM